jgi:cytochrome b
MALNELAVNDAPVEDAPPDETPRAGGTHRIQLWDLPIRIFHWSLLAAITTAIVTGKLGGEWMPLHGKAGIAIVGLLSFRIVWGLIGSGTARFAHFLPSPTSLLDYLRGRWRGLGHNPLGALSVVALLGLIGVQAGTGLFTNDDIAFTGPLAVLASADLSLWLTGWHRQLVNGLFVLIGLHLTAIFFHVKFKKDNIVKPMVTGWKEVAKHHAPPRPARRIALVAALVAGLAGAYAASGEWIPAPPPPPPAATSGTAPAAPAPAW